MNRVSAAPELGIRAIRIPRRLAFVPRRVERRRSVFGAARRRRGTLAPLGAGARFMQHCAGRTSQTILGSLERCAPPRQSSQRCSAAGHEALDSINANDCRHMCTPAPNGI